MQKTPAGETQASTELVQPRPFCYSVQLFTYEISHLSGKTFNVVFLVTVPVCVVPLQLHLTTTL